MLFYLPLLQFMQLIGGEIIVIAILMEKIKYLYTVIAPAGFWPLAKTGGGTLGFPACIHIRNFKM